MLYPSVVKTLLTCLRINIKEQHSINEMQLSHLKLKLLLTRQNQRFASLNCAIHGLEIVCKISSLINKKRTVDSEIWLCFSSISHILAYCYVNELLDKSNNQNSRHISLLVLSRTHFAPKADKSLNNTRKLRVIKFAPNEISSNILLLWEITRKLVRGHHIRLILPHLSEFIVGPLILKLAQLKPISLEFYDDGLLGCLSNPTALSFYPKKVSNIFRWDTTFWKAPVGISVLRQTIIPLKQFASYAEIKSLATTYCSNDLIVIEAKYMDYDLLNKIFSQASQCQDSSIVSYFQHPSFHKRNSAWPTTAPRRTLVDEQCETWLFKNISSRSHIYSSVTSSVILACEFALQGLTTSFKLTLLINSQKRHVELESFYDQSEALDFADCISSTYSEVVDLEIIKSKHLDDCCPVK